MSKSKIFVTSPFLPPLKEFIPYLERIWESKILTNCGQMHEELEIQLKETLEVDQISLFANGTLALITALQALRITGEVITTPFSFVASTHALHWNGIKPVFVDIEPDTFTIDPGKIEAAITPKTTAILPVHVYGNPCKMEAIENIAKVYGLKVIYDAAHAFGLKIIGDSIMNHGDLTILSFHATKVFHTFEGGAIISHTPEMKLRIDQLKNFGFAGETNIIAPGINAKMNEVQAAMGLLQVKYIKEIIRKRKTISDLYSSALAKIKGIKTPLEKNNILSNYAYYPILVNGLVYGKSREALYDFLKQNNIFTRRYFYPLISNFNTYKGLTSSSRDNLPVANKIAESVLCLPIYPDLTETDIFRIVELLRSFGR